MSKDETFRQVILLKQLFTDTQRKLKKKVQHYKTNGFFKGFTFHMVNNILVQEIILHCIP